MENCTLHLMNDDYNHHLDVQNALKDICGLDDDEAETFTYIVHVQGSFPVFEGSLNEAENMREKFSELGINTQITEVGNEPL